MKYLFIILTFCSINVFAKPVNINSADAKSISESLSGIGMKKAEAIVQYRTKNGPFKSAKELINVKGVGEKTLQKNEQDILISDTAVRAEKKQGNAKKAE